MQNEDSYSRPQTSNLKRSPLKRTVGCKGPLFGLHVCLAESIWLGQCPRLRACTFSWSCFFHLRKAGSSGNSPAAEDLGFKMSRFFIITGFGSLVAQGPGKTMAHDSRLLYLNKGLLLGIMAHYSGLLGFPGKVAHKQGLGIYR